MLFLGVALIAVGIFMLIWMRNIIGLIIAAAGVFILAMDIAKTIKKSAEKKKIKDSAKPLISGSCRYEEGLPFGSGDCTVTVFRDCVAFDVGGKNAKLDLTRITDASASDGSFRLTYSKDNSRKTVICSYDPDIHIFTEIADTICKNIKFEL